MRAVMQCCCCCVLFYLLRLLLGHCVDILSFKRVNFHPSTHHPVTRAGYRWYCCVHDIKNTALSNHVSAVRQIILAVCQKVDTLHHYTDTSQIPPPRVTGVAKDVAPGASKYQLPGSECDVTEMH